MSHSTQPWVEKYRPDSLHNIVLDAINKKIVKNILKIKLFPNLLFYGPPGTGKTTTILNLITDYQKKTTGCNKGLIIHLNASDERGIDIIRNLILDFANSIGLFQNGLKFVILDEIDSMTKSAQQALKILIQNITTPTRFCLITNYISRVDASLRNYCVSMRFNQLPPSSIYRTLSKINTNENIGMTKIQLQSIQKKYKSDMRSMINYMQTMQTNIQNIVIDGVWARLTELLEEDAKTDNILNYIDSTILLYNLNIQEFLKGYFNYIIRNNTPYINAKLLKFIENILHNCSSKSIFIKKYFVTQMKDIIIKPNDCK